MATLDTNLSSAPYYDDYDENKLHQRVLFKPSVSVQTRELNQLQTILGKQIERFGNAVYKSGTIVDGCNFLFKNPYPYAKIQDLDVNGFSAVVSQYKGLFATSSSGLRAFIIDTVDGFESTAPDLRTIYLQYNNAGNTGTANSFSPGDTLTVTDSNNSIYSVTVNNGGIGFANSDKLVFVPALVVNVSSGTFTNGEYVTQPDIGSNLQITSIDSTTLALAGQVILKLQPRQVDLANSLVLPNAWTVANNDVIRNASNTVTGTVLQVIGAGATGGVITDSTGKVVQTIMTFNGTGYTNTPYAGVRSPNNAVGLASLSLTPQNYVAKIKVANTSNPVGNGYAFGVTEGVIYQKGFFLRVLPQTVLVTKYSQSPNNLVVGFDSIEDIVNSDIDPTLKDNVNGDNSLAPGADRLRITPTLKVLNRDLLLPSNSFFSLVEWNDGNPFKQNQTSIYSNIGDEMARRTSDEAGDFSLDTFQVTTQSPADPTLEGNTVNIVVDPGTAYISGYRVSTNRNSIVSVRKGLDTVTTNNQVVGLTYGNYIRIKGVAGTFQYSTGDLIDLRDTAANALTTKPPVMTPVGASIGSARIRSMVYESGVPGTANAVYRLYLFNILMNTGKNFINVRSIFYNGTRPGIADIAIELDPISSANVALMHMTANSSGLLYPLAVPTIKNVNNATYTFRTVFQDAQIANTGILTYSLASFPNQNFPWIGNLSDSQAQSIYVVPLQRIIEANTRPGTLATSNASANVTGTGTSFITDFVQGDYVYASGNTTENVIRQVVSVVNNTVLVLDQNCSFTNTVATYARCFPNNVPIPFGNRAGYTVNTDSSRDILTINTGRPFSGGNVAVTLGIDVQRTNVTVGNKNASRDRFVAISLANSAGGISGPWCLGIPDVFRLKAVYLGANAAANTLSTNVTKDFYIDTRQNIDFLDLSNLVQRPTSSLKLTANNWLLVKFDHFTATSSGFYATPSYVSANAQQVALVDSQPLANLTTTINTMEIPEVFTAQGNGFDLLNCLDFRPIPANTVASVTDYTLAPVNPVYSLSFGNTADSTTDRQFPNPATSIVMNVEQYMGRVDSVFAAQDGSIFTLHGAGTTKPLNVLVEPNKPTGTMRLQSLAIPAYPTLPQFFSNTLTTILNMGRGNQNLEADRIKSWQVSPLLGAADITQNQPIGYSMKSIGSIDRRVKALEYYQSLSLLESSIVNTIIPSGVDPTTNRFKFGFFADDFSTQIYQNTTDPQYRAAIEAKCLVPSKVTWTAGHGSGNNQTCPHIDYLIVDQNYATGTKPNTNCYVTTTSTSTKIYNYHFRRERDEDDDDDRRHGRREERDEDRDDYFVFKIPTGATHVRVYIWAQSHGCLVTIYQANTRIYGGNQCVVLNPDDITFLQAPTFEERWFDGCDFPAYDGYVLSGINDDCYRHCRIDWDHDDSRGEDHCIRFRPLRRGIKWRVAVQYTISTTSTSVVPCPVPPVPVVHHCGYHGHLHWEGGMHVEREREEHERGEHEDDEERDFDRFERDDDDYEDRFCGSGDFHFKANGLRPYTLHSLISDGKDFSNLVRPDGGRCGDPLVTDGRGRLRFSIHLNIQEAADFLGVFRSCSRWRGETYVKLVACESFAETVIRCRFRPRWCRLHDFEDDDEWD